LKVGFHSPLPPVRSGVADYAAALLGALGGYGDVEAGAEQADIDLYHLGNNRLHRTIYARALARPGVVVLHDAVLHHFLLGTLSESEYIEEFVYNYGEWMRSLASELWRRRASSGSAAEYFSYSLVKRIAGRSLAVVVHNAAAAAIVRRHAPEAEIHEIPHLWREPPPVPAYEIERLRAALGIPPGAFLFGVFGYLRESKRLESVLDALGRVRRERPGAFLLIAGEFVSSDLERALESGLRVPGVVRLPFLENGKFWKAASAVDACINLRYPAAGETSGIALRMMGLRKPVILTAGEETAGFPESAAVRIDPGVAEREMLAHYMMWFTESPQAAREVGIRGYDCVRRHHHLDRVAGLYWNVLCASRKRR
jgi:glycosyltransferase involved in cell wall biosynthesis